MQVITVDKDIKDYEQITVSSTAIGCTTTKITATSGDMLGRVASEVFFRVESNTIRYRCDGTDPTTSVGIPLYAGETLILRSPNSIKKFMAIRVSADATLNAEYRY